MRIFIVNSLYPPSQVGGAERSVCVLAESLAAAGHEVEVACLADSEESREVVNGVIVNRVLAGNLYFPWDGETRGALARMQWHARDRGRASNQRKVEYLIDRFAPDVVHTNNLTGFGSGLLPAMARRNLPIVHTLRDFSLLCARASLHRRGEDCTTRCLTCRIISSPRMANAENATLVVGNSDYMVDRHRSEGVFADTPARTIYNAVPALGKPPRSGRRVARHGGRVRFGYMGMIKPEKGIEVLLEALSELHEADWSLTVAGTGALSYTQDLQQRYSALPITWLGFVPPAELFKAIELLVIPSIWPEPMPRTLIEATAAGVLTVCSDAGGTAEVAAMFPSASVYDHRDPKSLTALLRKACSTNCLEFLPPPDEVLARFSTDYLVNQYEEAYRDAYALRNAAPGAGNAFGA